MNRRLARCLLQCFPPAWRAEYGQEFEDLLRQKTTGWTDMVDVLWSALKEWARLPILRLSFELIAIGLGLFIGAVSLARPVWRVLSAPVHSVLRDHGFRPPYLTSDTPYGQFGVIWLGMPLLLTLFAIYPCLLVFAARLVAQGRTGERRTRMKSFVFCSGTVFLASFLVGLVLWSKGLPFEVLLAHGFQNPGAPADRITTIEGFFMALTESWLVWMTIWQVPVYLLYAWIWKISQQSEPKYD